MLDKGKGAGMKDAGTACSTMACIIRTEKIIESIQKAIETETEEERKESPAMCLHRRNMLERRKMLLEEYKSLMAAPSYEDGEGIRKISEAWRIFQAGTPLESIHKCIANAYFGYMPDREAIVVYKGYGMGCAAEDHKRDMHKCWYVFDLATLPVLVVTHVDMEFYPHDAPSLFDIRIIHLEHGNPVYLTFCLIQYFHPKI